MAIEKFQLTRSVGSVTDFTIKWVLHRHNFNSHAPWGAWRDLQLVHYYVQNFNSHAPWGAWRGTILLPIDEKIISTHTLRGERDINNDTDTELTQNFNSHAPWGAWLAILRCFYPFQNFNSHAPWGAWPVLDSSLIQFKAFQLTRSVGSVTRQ